MGKQEAEKPYVPSQELVADLKHWVTVFSSKKLATLSRHYGLCQSTLITIIKSLEFDNELYEQRKIEVVNKWNESMGFGSQHYKCYLLRFDRFSKLYKIGKSKTPYKRRDFFKNLRSRILRVYDFGNSYSAELLERQFKHKHKNKGYADLFFDEPCIIQALEKAGVYNPNGASEMFYTYKSEGELLGYVDNFAKQTVGAK